ncbi:polyprenyl synthetase family protein [Spirillospora sp. NBC_00431]
MNAPENQHGPFPFTERDLEPEKLAEGARETLGRFRRWRETNSGVVADHIEQHTDHLRRMTGGHRFPAVAGRRFRPAARRADERLRMRREAIYYAAYNMAEVIEPARVDSFAAYAQRHMGTVRNVVSGIDESRGAAGVLDSLEHRFPLLRGAPETRWLAGRLDRLHRMLPDGVVRSGSMGKVAKTVAGVLAIGLYDTFEAGRVEALAHLARILPAAYAYGAAYAIVDDSFQDLPGEYISADDRARCRSLIDRGLSAGERADIAELPDHPLVDELYELQSSILEIYPFEEYRHLYHAAHSLYLAQEADASWRIDDPPPGGLASMYPEIFVKAGMSRVVANILGRRRCVDDAFYSRCVNSIFVGQLRDDLIDHEEDAAESRLTPFTFPLDRADTNPLDDMFAYSAYVVTTVFDGDPDVADAMTYYTAKRMVRVMAAGDRSERFVRGYASTSDLSGLLDAASGVPRRALRTLDSSDHRFRRRAARIMTPRAPTQVDCRTFVADRLGFIEDARHRLYPLTGDNELNEIIAYAFAGTGKHLRPALSLMLAESLGVDPGSLEPALVACELFHTASLLFDDLPAHDGATLRRGKPAAHLVFDEADVQLAALSMISSGFGLIAGLEAHYPAHRVTKIINFLGGVLGPDRLCLGQHLDLALTRRDGPVTADEIIDMYALKTSTAMEAALVPLMMLLDRPAPEIELVRRYAHHAGIVFQLRDDILDATSSTERLGKDAGHDGRKATVVRVHGLAEAQRRLRTHLDGARRACGELAFDTSLLVCLVDHFASRRA